MSIAHALLGILADGPAHGYDVKRVYDQRFAGSKPLAFGQVYATLGRLQRDGLVEIAEVVQDGGPERTAYALTTKGHADLEAWLEKAEPPGPYPAEDLVRKTVTALHLGTDATGFLRRQRASHLALMRTVVAEQEAAADHATRIATDHLILHLDADLRWLETATQYFAADARDRPEGGGR